MQNNNQTKPNVGTNKSSPPHGGALSSTYLQSKAGDEVRDLQGRALPGWLTREGQTTWKVKHA